MVTIRTFKDSHTGNTVKAIGQKGSDTGHFYFTAMSWMSDSRRLVASAQIDAERNCRYLLIDTETGESQVLVDEAEWGGGTVSSDDKLYYPSGSAIRGLDLHTGEAWTVCTLEQGERFHEPLSVSGDGRTMGVYWNDGDEWTIGRIDIASGTITDTFAPGFAQPYEVADHAMVNPVDDQLIFFAHEGKTEHIPDRLWTFDARTGKSNNIYRQLTLEDGTLGEHVGHEMWTYDGEGVVFAKYFTSPIQPAGIYYADKRGRSSHFINGDYKYWHVAPSPDGRWVVADTHELPTRIVLVDRQEQSSRVLSVTPFWWSHPGHPHPAFSPDSKKVTYTFADEDNHLWIGIVEI
ncbi:hypothetical protein [Paenibacillus piri]|uniref:Oligogalacturonate lyase domain-containing protein n=1 Tax=Paenibacillus piri TaxID=2547395 RepID=A0A4R5KXX9_9BACL|nr:hypothetical protein [Paenibacillus piri]TDG00443.1 hypothetical protein E1757_02065 [Paenibacillus piri]